MSTSKLKILPAQLANMIAAGEVVQRPSSVVKELMENAVDSGADTITTIISDAGRTLIQVIDNGCGMSSSEALLCFERHATSKIASVEDLSNILSFGFRGEALASIASVAEVSLTTRRKEDETATKVKISAGQKADTSNVQAPVGSNFAVRNLFYNTPARRKFLKSDNIELKHIIEEFTRIAITRPDINFTLNSSGKDIFVLKKAASLKYRLQDIFGPNLLKELVDISADTSIIKVNGFVGRPDQARKTLGNQYFFVNGRYFKSPYLHKAVMKAYEELVPEGFTPSYFIFLQADPGSIDINIHPTKAEIKFEEDSMVFQTLYACVKEIVGRHSFGASIDFDTADAVELPHISKDFEKTHGLSYPSVSLDAGYNPFNSASEPDFKNFESTRKEDYSKLFDNFSAAQEPGKFIICGKFIIVSTPSGISIINSKRAHERRLYDKFIKALSSNTHITQTALFPVQVRVGAENLLLFEEHSELLSSLGFDISCFGTDTLVVNGVPEGYSCESSRVSKMIEDLVYILSEDVSSLPELMQQAVSEKLALLGSSTLNSTPSYEEARELIDIVFAEKSPELTSKGQRIVKRLSMEDIDKLF